MEVSPEKADGFLGYVLFFLSPVKQCTFVAVWPEEMTVPSRRGMLTHKDPSRNYFSNRANNCFQPRWGCKSCFRKQKAPTRTPGQPKPVSSWPQALPVPTVPLSDPEGILHPRSSGAKPEKYSFCADFKLPRSGPRESSECERSGCPGQKPVPSLFGRRALIFHTVLGTEFLQSP